MRKLLIAVLFALPFVALAAPPKTVTLDVQNMTCGLCPITVKKSLEKVSGVSDVQVNFDQKTATVTYDPDKAQPEALTEATANAGYPPQCRSEVTMSAIVLESVLTCPRCGFAKPETMPTDACQFYYECSNCKVLLRPNPGIAAFSVRSAR
jgi:mercuric ion binding protein